MIRQWLDRLLWALLTAVAGYASTQLRDMSSAIQALNQNVAVVINQVSTQKERQAQVEAELSLIRMQVVDVSTRVKVLENF